MNNKIEIQGAGKDQVIQSNEIGVTYQQIQTLIQTTAWQDKEFKSKVLKDPKAALESRFGIKFDKDINVKVDDQTCKDSVYFYIPHNPAETTAEDLAGVSGGAGALMMGAMMLPGLIEPIVSAGTQVAVTGTQILTSLALTGAQIASMFVNK